MQFYREHTKKEQRKSETKKRTILGLKKWDKNVEGFAHTWLEVCVLTVPSRLLRAMSAYAERKAAGTEAEIRLNTSSTHSLQVAGTEFGCSLS